MSPRGVTTNTRCSKPNNYDRYSPYMKQNLAVLLITRLHKLLGGFQMVARHPFSQTEYKWYGSSQLEIKRVRFSPDYWKCNQYSK